MRHFIRLCLVGAAFAVMSGSALAQTKLKWAHVYETSEPFHRWSVWAAQEIEKRTGFETRSVVLGHIQRGGSPSAFDRVLATRYGLGAIDMVHRGEFGKMAALRGNKIVSVPLADAIASNRKVDPEMINVATGILDKLENQKEPVAR